MSDVDRGARGWRFYIRDMIECAERVLSYTEGLDQAAFLADERTWRPPTTDRFDADKGVLLAGLCAGWI